ncbi:putative pentatricopeptide repeat-containing protein At5g52630 [Magnolia sinica]|uniref:putative pentatricopeptide repeat-containing protein At5g52630 n=1 Tax=Magnolia sinica TaxID=86752 RepID=UPI002658D630|nr:putative pentatricopeptide repeat-containing protein At5g52630 [Magnolia sinica]
MRPLQIPRKPFQHLNTHLSISTVHLSTFLQNRSNSVSFEQCYRDLCSLLQALTFSRSLTNGQQLHAHVIKTGVRNIALLSNYLINFYSKCQRPFDSRQVFDEIPYKKPTSWSSVISSFAQNELPDLSLEFFRRMLEAGIRPDDHIFPSATKSCAILSSTLCGRSIHSLALKTGFDLDVFVGSSLVDMYAKCGEIRDARQMFDEMPERNVVSWSGMIYGYAQFGEDEEALRLFKRALAADLAVNDFTYSSVIRVCGHSTLLELGSQVHCLCLKTSFNSSSFVGSSLISLYSKCGIVEEAYRVFDQMPDRNLGAWNSMLIACAQHGHTQKAFKIFGQMEMVGIRPNFITFLCMLSTCSHAGLVEKGEIYFRLMSEHGIEPGAQHYACMVDLLGRAGKLPDAVTFIEKMPIEPTESIWGALLTGSRIHGDTETAAFAADKLFESGSMSSGAHVLLSNAYAAVGRWADAARARKMMRDRGVKKETGLSWVEEGNRVHTFASGDRSHPVTEEIYRKLAELEKEMERAGYIADTSFVLHDLDSEEKKQAIRYHSERLAIAFGLISFPPDRLIRVMKNLRICGDCHTAIKFVSKCTARTVILRDNNRFHRFEGGMCSCGDYW